MCAQTESAGEKISASAMIFSLPNELLCGIFEHLVPASDSAEAIHDTIFTNWEGEPPRTCIQNLRLTCRRFCAIASHLLLDHVKVSMTKLSLERFLEIAATPEIFRGVRGVYIDVSLYSPALGSNFDKFRQFATDNVSSYLRTETSANTQQPSRETDITRSRLESLLDSWKNEDISSVKLGHLTRAQSLLRNLANDQRAMLLDESFSKAIVGAMLKMPSARSVLIDDRNTVCHDLIREGISPKTTTMSPTWRRLIDKLLQEEDYDELAIQVAVGPIWWMDSTLQNLGDPPVQVVSQILACLGKQNVRLRSLNVVLSYPSLSLIPEMMNGGQDEALAISTACEALSIFGFRLSFFEWSETASAYSAALRSEVYDTLTSLIRACLSSAGTSSIRRLTLDLDPFRRGITDSLPLMAVAPDLLWPRLEYVCLHRCIMGLDELRTFIASVQGKPVLKIWRLELSSGTWAEALDVLHAKAGVGSQVFRPSGEAYEMLPLRIQKNVFLSGSMQHHDAYDYPGDYLPNETTSLADNYICGNQGQNPIREWLQILEERAREQQYNQR